MIIVNDRDESENKFVQKIEYLMGPGEEYVTNAEKNKHDFNRKYYTREKQEVAHEEQDPTTYASVLVVH